MHACRSGQLGSHIIHLTPTDINAPQRCPYIPTCGLVRDARLPPELPSGKEGREVQGHVVWMEVVDALERPIPLVQDNLAWVNIHQTITRQHSCNLIRGRQIVRPPVTPTCNPQQQTTLLSESTPQTKQWTPCHTNCTTWAWPLRMRVHRCSYDMRVAYLL